MERLGDVIVGAGFERFDFPFLIFDDADHQNGEPGLQAAQLRAGFDSVLPGHVDVEENGIVFPNAAASASSPVAASPMSNPRVKSVVCRARRTAASSSTISTLPSCRAGGLTFRPSGNRSEEPVMDMDGLEEARMGNRILTV